MPLLETVKTAFNEAQWQFEEVAGREVIETIFEAHHTRVPLHLQIFAELNLLQVVSNLEAKLHDEHRLVICELLMRTNGQMTLGNFEVDWDRFQIFFRAGQFVFEDSPHTAKIVRTLVSTAIKEVDRLAPQVALIARQEEGTLANLNIIDLMKREDLLPPIQPPEEERL